MNYSVVQFGEALFERHGPSLFEETVRAGGRADGLPVDAHCVVEGDFQRRKLRYGDFDFYRVLECRRVAVAAFHFDHGRHDALGLHTVEAVAELVHPVHARLFHKADVVAVVRDAHTVALVVFHLVTVGIDVHFDWCILIGDF